MISPAAKTVLVAGGTSESREVTRALLDAGFTVIWSQATETPFTLPQHSRLERRWGRLSIEGWRKLVQQVRATVIVDAGHPHAIELRATLRAVAADCQIPLLRLTRPPLVFPTGVTVATDHPRAARLACENATVVVATIGSRHLATYVEACASCGCRLIARVLDCEETRGRLATHRDVSQLRWGRGPFSVEENLELLSVPGRVVLVTKDSGERGGLLAKFEAARRVGARVIVVSRPVEAPGATSSVSELIACVKRSCS